MYVTRAQDVVSYNGKVGWFSQATRLRLRLRLNTIALSTCLIFISVFPYFNVENSFPVLFHLLSYKLI